MVGEFGEVLVMDWGLAKTIGESKGTERREEGEEGKGQEAEADLRKASAVQTVRDDANVQLTMEGAIAGSPLYLAPEQAESKNHLLDHRTDIYSLGGILYEILTLEPPVEGRTVHEVLLKVAEGNITPPEQRTPSRNIPKELSAVAMKAMTKNRRLRYQSVQDLSKDISLYLQGRAVSAKEYSFVEGIAKLVKRNKGIAVCVAAAFVILAVMGAAFTIDNIEKRKNAEQAQMEAEREREAAENARDEQRRTALAASERYALQAVHAAEFYRWEEAEQRAEDAEAIASDGPWGPFARGHFAQLKNDHETARTCFQQALENDPSHVRAREALSESQAFLESLATARALLNGDTEMKDWRALIELGRSMLNAEKFREAEAALVKAIKLLERARDGTTSQKTEALNDIKDTKQDLLIAKACIACQGFEDTIRDLPPEEQRHLVEEKLSETHGTRIQFAGVKIEAGKWIGASLRGTQIKHIVPLRGLHLEEFSIGQTAVTDLTPLRGMPLQSLDCCRTEISDLSPLKGMPLQSLDCNSTRVSDLTPLKGMPLQTLNCRSTRVSDLTPLKGMSLRELRLPPKQQLTPESLKIIEELEKQGCKVTW